MEGTAARHPVYLLQRYSETPACHAEDAVYINKGDVYEDENIRIEAFGSTDVGISFLIDLQGVRLFHAGDLNNWHWSEESTPQEIRKAEGDFLAEIKNLQQKAPP